MRLKLACILLLLLFVFPAVPAVAQEAQIPAISAETAILYCANNSEVLFEKDCDKRMKPASTTKIMTALLAVEASSANNSEVTFTNDMIAEGSSMYLKLGDKIDLRSLAEGMMLVSGNDAANAIAFSMRGSKEKFAELMNSRAQQLNMTNTHFMNPSGLDHEEHYSTARDLAILMAYALENPDFAEITAEKNAKIDFIAPENKSSIYSNHNKLLSMYQYCIGGKTGYTMAAGRCLVTAAEKDGLLLIAVTMNDRNDWQDHIALFDYGFSQLEIFAADDTSQGFEVPVAGGRDNESVTLRSTIPVTAVVPFGSSERIERRVSVPDSLNAPVEISFPYGEITYTLDGIEIAAVPLCSDRTVLPYDPTWFEKIINFFNNILNKEK